MTISGENEVARKFWRQETASSSLPLILLWSQNAKMRNVKLGLGVDKVSRFPGNRWVSQRGNFPPNWLRREFIYRLSYLNLFILGWTLSKSSNSGQGLNLKKSKVKRLFLSQFSIVNCKDAIETFDTNNRSRQIDAKVTCQSLWNSTKKFLMKYS